VPRCTKLPCAGVCAITLGLTLMGGRLMTTPGYSTKARLWTFCRVAVLVSKAVLVRLVS
jgi:hypothetical protein